MGLNAKHIVSSSASWRCNLEKYAKTLQVAGDLYLILLRNTKSLWVCASGSRGRPANPQHVERCYSKFYLVVAEDLWSYKILQIDPNHGYTHVLDSTKNAWETGDGRSPPSFHLRQGAVYMGVLCAVCMQDNINNFVTSACDENTNTWTEVGDKVPPTIHFLQVVPCNGSLVLVTKVSKVRTELQSFKLDPTQWTWQFLWSKSSWTMSYSLTDSHASVQTMKVSLTPWEE